MTTNIPSWKSFLQAIRLERDLTISELAASCGVSRSTIAVALGNTRPVERPHADVALKIAQSLNIPQLAMAIVAGYMDAQTDKWPDFPHDQNLMGGSYLTCCREQQGFSVDQVVQRWNAADWTVPITRAEWFTLEQQGVLPDGEGWSAFDSLADLPGVWLWAIVRACAMLQNLFSDLVGLAFVLGRINSLGPHRGQWMRGHDDADKLRAAFGHAMDSASGIAQFRESVINLSLYIPQPPTSPHQSISSEASADLSLSELVPVRAVLLCNHTAAELPPSSSTHGHPMVCMAKNVPGDFVIEAPDNTMMSVGIHQGDWVILQRAATWQDVPDRCLVVASLQGTMTVRYFVRDPVGLAKQPGWLRAAHPAHADHRIDATHDQVLGVVVSIHTIHPPTPESSSFDPFAGLTLEQRQLVQQVIVQMRGANHGTLA